MEAQKNPKDHLFDLFTNPWYQTLFSTFSSIISYTHEFYKQKGDTMKSCYSGSKAWILSGNLTALKNLGLHPSKKIKLFNGPLECRLECFEMYEGSKKKKYEN